MVRLLGAFAAAGANLVEVQHRREGVDLHVRETGVHATFEVHGRDHAQRVLDAVLGDAPATPTSRQRSVG